MVDIKQCTLVDCVQVCSEFNPDLRRAFNQTRFFNGLVKDDGGMDPNNTDIFDGPPDKIGNWTSPPTCMFGIPGITRSITIVGKGTCILEIPASG